MKTNYNTSKRKSRRLISVCAASFVACVFGWGIATCDAQVPNWESDGPPQRLAKDDAEQKEQAREAQEEKAFREKIKNVYVQARLECEDAYREIKSERFLSLIDFPYPPEPFDSFEWFDDQINMMREVGFIFHRSFIIGFQAALYEFLLSDSSDSISDLTPKSFPADDYISPIKMKYTRLTADK